MAKKKVLVCGATGFLGKNIAESLADTGDYEVTGIYCSREPQINPHLKTPIHFKKADLTDKAQVKGILDGQEVVLHYAALATNFKDVLTRPHIHTTDNIVMTSLLLREAFEVKTPHFVFPSCGYLYNASDKAWKEEEVDYNNIPKSYFASAWSKTYCEKMCEFYSMQGRTKFTVFRQANVYGPYDKLDLDTAHALPATVMKAISSKDNRLEVWGDGTQKKDLIYISDLTDMIKAVLQKKQNTYDFVNVGSGQFVTMRQIAECVVAVSGRNIQVDYNTDKPSSPLQWRIDPSRAKAVFGWEPKVSLMDGMKKTYEWYRSKL